MEEDDVLKRLAEVLKKKIEARTVMTYCSGCTSKCYCHIVDDAGGSLVLEDTLQGHPVRVKRVVQ